MNRRRLFLGAGALLMAPAVAHASIPAGWTRIRGYERISDDLAEEAFTKAFQESPKLTWEWGDGFRLGGKIVSDDDASRWDRLSASRVKSLGEEKHKRAFKDALRDEFHREYGPRKTLTMDLSLDDAASIEKWGKADAIDIEAWNDFRARKHRVGLLPDWYVREVMPSLISA